MTANQTTKTAMDVALQLSIMQEEIDKLTRERNELINILYEQMSRNTLFLISPHTFLFSHETIGSIMNQIATGTIQSK